MIALGLFVALFGAQPRAYSIDGITLGSNIRDVIAARGQPHDSSDDTYNWFNSAGGKVTVMTDSRGAITFIDLLVGPRERRSTQVPWDEREAEIIPGETAHVNYVEPRGAVLNDRCGAGLNGAPCFAFTLPGGLEYVVNFGTDSGFADWYMSEVIVGSREALIRSGRVIACGRCGD